MKHSLLFTGHMIDAKDRANPRFPADKETKARENIRNHLLKEKETAKDELRGIASGACGGDILFHELCIELGIPAEIYLALPTDQFKQESVSFAGNEWDIRFDKLIKKLPVHILPGSDENDKDKNVWASTNLWMLDAALESGGENMTLIALWDGKGGDGDGGTEHMVKVARDKGAKVKIIDTNKL